MMTALPDIRGGLMALVAGLLAVCGGPAAAQLSTPLGTESYLIPSGAPGSQRYVRNKRPGAMTTFRADRTGLYVHGATQASETTCALALDGESWMDPIAEQGWDVWLMAGRGFGGATKLAEMDRPATDSPPIAPAGVARRDVQGAVEHSLGTRGLSWSSLLGWSRGAHLVGWYASETPDTVHRRVRYAPAWLRSPAPAVPPAAPIPASQTWSMEPARTCLQAGVPPEQQGTLRPSAWRDAWGAAPRRSRLLARGEAAR